MGLFLVVLGLIAVYLFHFYFIRRRQLPPGPFPFPFIGNTYSFAHTPIDTCVQKWKDEYGDVMTVFMGHVPMVTIHDSKLIYDMFVKDGDAYIGRAQQRWNEIFRPAHTGLIFSEGSLWRDNRRFALQVFRNLGLGRNIMQERVLDDVTLLIDFTKKELNAGTTEFNFFDELDISVGSIINSITFGYRFSRDNRTEFIKAKKIATEQVLFGGSILYRTMEEHRELFRYLPFFRDTYQMIMNHTAEFTEFLSGQVATHRKNIDLESDEEPTDYVEAYLKHQHKLDKEGVKDHPFSETQLYSGLLDLWVAGQETTATTLAWMVIYIIQNPEVQKKCQAEMDEFVGDRIVTLDDKVNLNYVNATVAESQRLCNLVPINVPHRTTRDVEIRGYKIPKHTVILNQISTVMYDERYFPGAKTFKPERFLDEKGKFFAPPELMPFSVGKRACLGEGLARLELFLFTANLLNQFKFGEVPGKPITGERIVSATTAPAPWVCSISVRH
uniref:Unspecific monooxygenase n=1 Tax=Panagrellus redivivus TaxID=6233 RepID=A0A7E4UXK1_PANRE